MIILGSFSVYIFRLGHHILLVEALSENYNVSPTDTSLNEDVRYVPGRHVTCMICPLDNASLTDVS